MVDLPKSASRTTMRGFSFPNSTRVRPYTSRGFCLFIDHPSVSSAILTPAEFTACFLELGGIQHAVVEGRWVFREGYAASLDRMGDDHLRLPHDLFRLV